MGIVPIKRQDSFFAWDGNASILLSHFMKNTQKTPKREIEKVRRLMQECRWSCLKNRMLKDISFDDLDEGFNLGNKCQSLMHGEKSFLVGIEFFQDFKK